MKILILSGLLGAGLQSFACEMDYEKIPVYEKQILKVLDGPKAAEIKDLKTINKPLSCLIEMSQKGSGQMRLAIRNSFFALIGGESLPGESEAEMKRFQRSALLLKTLGNSEGKHADYLNEILSGFLKGEWESYKLFCEKGDISHCLVFLPKEKEVEAQDDLVAAAAMMKWQIAHTKVDLKQRAELEKRIKNLYEKRNEYSVLKRWFIEKIYFEMMPKELPMGMAWA